MDRIARLISSSTTLRRRIWASLPFSYRVADFCSRIAVTTTDAFGKTVYGEFLTHGITGMPDIHGKPAEEFDITKKPIANRLPSSYGSNYGKTVFRKLMSRFHLGPDATEQIMLDFLVEFLDKGSDELKEGTPLHSAERYVLNRLEWGAKNYIRKKREVSDIYRGEGGQEVRREVPVEFDEEAAEKELERQLPRLQSRLRAIHPDAALYVKLSLVEGYSDREIIGDVGHGVDSMLPHPHTIQGKPLTENAWGMTYKRRIFDLLKRNFGEQWLEAV